MITKLKFLNLFFAIAILFLIQACQVKSGDAPGGGIFSGHQPTANAFTLTTQLNRTYFPGENIDFTLSFPKSVTITGTPTLALTIGSTSRTASFLSGNNSSTLVFRYTVAGGENDTDGISVGTTLGMSGATCTYDSTSACGTTIQIPSLTSVRVLSNVPPVANNITPPAFDEDTQSIITLSYSDAESDLATACTLSGLVKVQITQACACDGAGVCTVGVTSTPNANGAGSFNYTVTANSLTSNSATASLTINPIADAPQAFPVNAPSFNEGTQSVITLNYSDADSDLASSCSVSGLTNVTVTQACACSSGICTVGVTGSPLNYSGPGSFNYTVTANAQVSNSAPVTFTIDDVSNPPVANNISPAAFNEDTQSIITLSYTDPDGDQAVSCTITSPSNVTVTQACACAAGVCTVGVTGTTDYNGAASFNYTVNTGANSNVATATLSITAVDDAPVTTNITPPAFDENTQSIITLAYSDVESDQASSCSVTNLSNVTETQACACAAGVCTVGVTGTLNYAGPASFDFTVTANSAVSNISTANLTINDLDNAPVADNISPASFNEDVQSVITLSYSDSDGDLATSCTLSSLTNVTETQACACDGLGVCTVGVTGTADYNGTASFNYTVTANSNTSNAATASLIILPVDDAPVANNITPPNFDKNTESIMTLSYSDAESDLATTCSISNLSNVTVTTACACDGAGVCTVGVTGTSNYFGAASFDYTVTANSAISNVASSTFTIDDTNTAPVADNISPPTFNEDVQSIITLSYSDADSDLASTCTITSPSNVTETQACACDGAGVCTVGVTGTADYNGAASFNYTVTANGQASNSATASLVILPVDDAPVADNITPPNFAKNTESIMTLSYSDVESDLATTCSISNLSNVTVTQACACAAGTCTVGVTGTSNYFGAASFDYTVTANSAVSNVASSTFTIDDTNTAPVADNITPASFNEDAQSVITLSYSDVDTDLASSCAITSPTNVTVTQACACDGAGVCTVGVTGTADYNGAASFNYTVTANGQASNSASATLTIDPVDDAPVADNITPPNFDKNTQSVMTLSYSDVESDQATTCSISNLSNVTVTQACACAAGTCTVGVTGTSNYFGAASFDYTVTANSAVSNVASSTFTIDNTNTAPVADNITPASFNEDVQSVITLSYSDVDTDLASSCSITSPTNVTVTQACACDGAGVCTVGVTGTANYNGSASFNYTVTANGQASNSASATLTIDPVDDAPVADNITPPNFDKNTESIMTLSYSDVESDLATTCSISNLSNVTVTTACACAAGTCTVGVTGTSNYFGAASFDYTVTANSAVSNVASSTFTIDNTNTPPVADNITPASFDEDVQSVITLSYSDVDSDLATSCSVSSPTNITVTQACACAAGTCTVGVTGSADYNGAASFNYTVTANSQVSNSASATLTIDPVDDAPVASNITPPDFGKNTQSMMTLSYTDVESDQATTCSISNLSNVTVTQACACAAGTCTVGVTGTLNYSGAASFDYTVTANGLASNVASSNFNIIENPPVADNITPAAFNEDTQSVITLSYSDADGDQASSCAITSPSNVTVTQACACAAGTCTVGVTGTADYNGAASFNYTVTAAGQGSNSATATLSITAVDDAPVANNITPPNFNKNTQSVMTLSYSDVESDQATTCTISNLNNVTVTQACACAAGTCTVGVTGTSNYFGAASFDYTVTANSLTSNVASSTFTIDDFNTPPVADNISPAAFNEDTQSVITLSYSDVDGDLASSCSITSPTNVTVTQACACAAGTCTVGVTGTADYNGAASFNYTVTANTQASNSATATLSITAVDDKPTGVPLTPAAFDEDTQSPGISLTYNDVEGDQATSCTISNLTNVTVTSACTCSLGACTVAVTGTAHYYGTASFDYTVTANGLTSDPRPVSLTINSVLDAPTTANITPPSFNEDTQSIITLPHTIVGGDAVTACAVTSPVNVTVTQACACAAGTCTVGVTGTANYFGAASFQWTVSAGSAQSVSRNAALTINSVNDLPQLTVIANQTTTVDVAKAVNFDFTDVESTLACSSARLSMTSTNTTLVPNANVVWSGSWTQGTPTCTATITPAAGQAGTTTITITGTDTNGGSANRSFTLTVGGPSLKWFDGAAQITLYDFGTPGNNTTKVLTLRNVGTQASAAITITDNNGSSKIGASPLSCPALAVNATCSITFDWTQNGPGGLRVETFDTTDGTVSAPTLTVQGTK